MTGRLSEPFAGRDIRTRPSDWNNATRLCYSDFIIFSSYPGRRSLLALTLLILTGSSQANAASQSVSPQGGLLGLGLTLGEPTGLSGKFWRDSRQAIDGGFAYSFGKF